jgi:hypothetical protein
VTYEMELLAQERLADLRGTTVLRPTTYSETGRWRRSLRTALGRALVRLGSRLAQPAGVPATR